VGREAYKRKGTVSEPSIRIFLKAQITSVASFYFPSFFQYNPCFSSLLPSENPKAFHEKKIKRIKKIRNFAIGKHEKG
jgi:hypothetical protein